MPSKYITNPKTGRRVLRDGPTGRKVLKARSAKRARSRRVTTRRPITRRYPRITRRYPRRYTQSYQRALDDIDTYDYTSMSDVYGLDMSDLESF